MFALTRVLLYNLQLQFGTLLFSLFINSVYKIQLESKILCISVITGVNVIDISRINMKFIRFIEIKLSRNIEFI